MFTDHKQQIKNAVKQGAYTTAYNIGLSINPESGSYKECWVLTILAQIGMSDLKDINQSRVLSDLSYAVQELFNSIEDINRFEDMVCEYLSICEDLLPSIRTLYISADEELKQQYIGTSGISLDSDDPNEKAKAQREREYNNQINKKRHALKLKYESVCKIPFDSIIKGVIASDSISDKYRLSLGFCDKMKEAAKFADESTLSMTKTFVLEVKKARIEHYWCVHSAEYEALVDEKDNLEKLIKSTINQKIKECQLKIETTTQEKTFAIKERRRYALFNQTDRKPHTIQITQAKKTIKRETEKLSELNKGVCLECDPHKARVKEIEAILCKQR